MRYFRSRTGRQRSRSCSIIAVEPMIWQRIIGHPKYAVTTGSGICRSLFWVLHNPLSMPLRAVECRPPGRRSLATDGHRAVAGFFIIAKIDCCSGGWCGSQIIFSLNTLNTD